MSKYIPAMNGCLWGESLLKGLGVWSVGHIFQTFFPLIFPYYLLMSTNTHFWFFKWNTQTIKPCPTSVQVPNFTEKLKHLHKYLRFVCHSQGNPRAISMMVCRTKIWNNIHSFILITNKITNVTFYINIKWKWLI